MKSYANSSEALRRTLAETKTTQKDLADTMGVSQAYVSAIVSGKKPLSPGTADKVATALGLAASETVSLHRAAAIDQGFKLDLPDTF